MSKLTADRETGPALRFDIVNAFPEMTFVVSSSDAILIANRVAMRRLRLDAEDLSRVAFADLLAADHRTEYREALERALRGEEPGSIEVHLAIADGTTLNVSLLLSRYITRASTAEGVCLIVARDMAEAKKKELDLLRFSKIAHYTANPVEITDVDGRIIYVNPAFEKASGYTFDEVSGRNPNVFGSGKHPPAFWKAMWDTVRAGNVWNGEVENKRRSGEPYHTHLLVSPIMDADHSIIGYFAVHRDMTEQKHLEKQLIHAQKMESIGLLAAGIAHEVGNPLTSISSLVQVIQRTINDDFTLEKLELIKNQVGRISRIIRDLVDFSRRSSFEVQMTDVNKILQGAIEIVRVGRKSKEIQFTSELDTRLPMLRLVPDQIEQVFINIIINAVDAVHAKYAGSGKPVAGRGEIVVHSELADDHLVVQIRDNGKGIPQQNLGKIFEPFFTTKGVGEGTGLGLWVSYGIIKSFKGGIEVSSAEGEGTTFSILLPARVEHS